jgi:hypothetical protein
LAAANVVINEVLAHTDFPAVDQIELTNLGGAPIDVAGWWLSDSNDNYFKYQIAGGSILANGGYITFDESQFNNGPSAFGLSAGGDDVWLIETDSTGRPIRFADRVEFDATLNGVSLGRVPGGSGELFPLSSRSLGAANGPHLAGAVVVSEVHYHPATPPGGSTITEKQLEFIELTNRSGTTIDLTDWRLRGGVDFNFMSGTVLANRATLVLVSFDPNNAVLNSEFRTIHGITGAVTLFGPWTGGALDNGGDTVKLLAPTDPPAGEPGPAYYLVDRVTYNDVAPWPTTPDGAGNSLQRLTTENYGDLAASWRAAAPTVGIPYLAGIPGDYDGNGRVEQADLALWKATYGSTTDLRADGNGDDLVDAADYTVWRDNFGATTAGIQGDYDSNGAVALSDHALWAGAYGSTTDLRSDGNGDDVVDAADYTVWRDNLDASAGTAPSVAYLQAGSPQLNVALASSPVDADALARRAVFAGLGQPRLSGNALPGRSAIHSPTDEEVSDESLLLYLASPSQRANDRAQPWQSSTNRSTTNSEASDDAPFGTLIAVNEVRRSPSAWAIASNRP